MKKFTVNCNFGGQSSPISFYVGNPEPGHHPLHFQADWLAKERGGSVPAELMESLQKIQAIALKNGVPFEDLFEYAFTSTQLQHKED